MGNNGGKGVGNWKKNKGKITCLCSLQIFEKHIFDLSFFLKELNTGQDFSTPPHTILPSKPLPCIDLPHFILTPFPHAWFPTFYCVQALTYRHTKCISTFLLMVKYAKKQHRVCPDCAFPPPSLLHHRASKWSFQMTSSFNCPPFDTF